MKTTSVRVVPSRRHPREADSHRCLALLKALSRVVQKRAGAAAVPWTRPLEKGDGFSVVRANTLNDRLLPEEARDRSNPGGV
eukprot:6856697-Prorocentrum_lima.AAC.1